MTSTDPAKALAKTITDLQRQVSSMSRGSQLVHSSLIVDGETVTVAGTVRTATTALATANGKNTVTYSAAAPSGVGKTEGDIWYRMADGVVDGTWQWTGTAWEAHSFGDAVLDSLTVGKLVTGEIAVGQKIIAGPAGSTHAEMSSTGFRVFQDDPVDSIPNEVVRMGTTNVDGTPTNDFIGVVSGTGELLASIDDTGQGNFQTLNVTGEAYFKGRTLDVVIGETGTGEVGYFEAFPPDTGGGFLGPVQDRVGIAEVNAVLQAGRRYELTWKATWMAGNQDEEARFVMTNTAAPANDPDNAPTVLVTSNVVDAWLHTEPVGGRWITASNTTTFNPTTSGRHRFLLCIERGVGTGSVFVVSSNRVIMRITDVGPARVVAGGLSQGGGQLYQGPPPPPPPPPTQQYYVDLGMAGKASWRGDGSYRTDLGASGVVQGWDPSGYNGDGKGMYYFNLPNITGNVDRVDVYMYAEHWYYNAGGTVIMNISDQRGVNANFFKFKENWHVGGYPKPGGKTVTVPWDWWPLFKGTNNDNYNGRATCITLGPSGGTDLSYYGRITDCRLRIWYTQ